MAFIPIANTAQANVQFRKDGQLMENVFYVQGSEPWDVTNLIVLGQIFVTWCTNDLMVLVDNATQFTGVHLRDMSSSTGISTDVAPTGTVMGSGGSATLSNSETLAIHKVSGAGGSHSKARVYVPSIPGAAKAGVNTVSTASANEFCNAYVQLIDAVAAIVDFTAVLGFVSLVDNKIPLVAGVFHEILNFICKDTIIDSQRRRLPGRGR